MTIARYTLLVALRAVRREGLSSRTYHLLVAELFRSLVGYLMLTVAGLIFTGYAFVLNPTPVTSAVLLSMLVLSCGRVALYGAYRQGADDPSMRNRAVDTAKWELAFAAIAISTAVLIGYTVFAISSDPTISELVCALIISMGIAGGISGRNGSRPRIAYAQVAVIMTPLIASIAKGPAPYKVVSCTLLSIFLLATYLSIRAFYHSLKGSFESEGHVQSLANKLKRSADLFDVALNNMTSGLLFFNKEKKVIIANDRVKETLGRPIVERMVGRATHEFYEDFCDSMGMSSQDEAALREAFGRIREGRLEGRTTMFDRRRKRVFELRMMPIADQGIVMNIDDVTEQRAKDEEINRLAHYDILTGLPNRYTFEERLRSVLGSPAAAHITICYVDLDGFKAVNDSLGHGGGDQLLRTVAERIDATKRDRDFSARLAGDEFGLILDTGDEAEAEALVGSIIEAISSNLTLAGRVIRLGASAGMVMGSDLLLGVDEALRAADAALQEAKKKGRGTALWYDRAMDMQARHRSALLAQLAGALETSQFSLAYHPIVDARKGRIVACEALARWHHPEFGAIPPSVFIPLAEQSGLIHVLGRWAINQACRDLKAWGRGAVRVAVNVSPIQFQNVSLVDVIAQALRDTGVAGHLLEIEITESAIASDPEQMKEELERVSRLGVGIALDDFGTGYSSLSLLHDLPIDKVKLDSSFVAALDKSPSQIRLVSSILQMTRTMNKELVVEGVETYSQLAALLEAQVRFIQGFYYCKPMKLDDVQRFVGTFEDFAPPRGMAAAPAEARA